MEVVKEAEPTPEPLVETTAGALVAGQLKHVQVREYVRSLISDATPGSPAPSERELVARFSVARMTVRQALDALVTEGLLQRVPGRGTFVSKPRDKRDRLMAFSAEMALRDQALETQTIMARSLVSGASMARSLEMQVGAPVIHWRRLRCTDQGAVCVEDDYLPEDRFPGLLSTPMPTSLFQALRDHGYPPTHAEDRITAGAVLEDDATLLEVPSGHPVLRLDRRLQSDGTPVCLVRSVFRSDRYAIRRELSD